MITICLEVTKTIDALPPERAEVWFFDTESEQWNTGDYSQGTFWHENGHNSFAAEHVSHWALPLGDPRLA